MCQIADLYDSGIYISNRLILPFAGLIVHFILLALSCMPQDASAGNFRGKRMNKNSSAKYYSNPLTLFGKACRFYAIFRKAEAFSTEQLAEYQFKHLRSVLEYAGTHVPYYRRAFRECGFEVGDFKQLADINGLPYLTKDILRKEDPALFLSDEADHLGVAYLKTSGTTGVPLQFACDIESRAAKYALTYRAFHEAGYNIGATHFVFKNCFYSNRAFAYTPIINRVSMHAYMNSKANCVECDKLLREHPPRHVLAHPNALLEFARSIPDARYTFRKTRGITTLSEPLTPELRRQIEEATGSKAFDYYSNMESSLIGYEVLEGKFLLGEHFSFNEIIPLGGDPLEGEIVSTTFFSKAMPLIRYRNADVVKLANPSNSAFRTIREVAGRISEAIVLPDGNKVRVFNLMHSQLENVMMYQIVQESPVSLCVDYVKIDKSNGVDVSGMIEELRHYLGNEVNITSKSVDALQKTPAGKIPRIISKY